MSEQAIAEIKTAYEALLQSHGRLEEQVAANAGLLAGFQTVPIGTILSFYGDPAQLDRTKWVACTSEEHDRRPEIVPNLEGKFLMGVGLGVKDVVGGRTNLTPQGNHSHGGVTGSLGPYVHGEINFPRGPGHQDPYSHRHGISDDGAHDHGGDLRPPFHGVSYIIRIA